jgi:hypothetical protein
MDTKQRRIQTSKTPSISIQRAVPDLILNFLIMRAALFLVVVNSLASAAPPPPPAVVILEKQYSALLNATCGRVVPLAPSFPAADEASFMHAYTQFNGTGSEESVISSAKQLLSDPGVDAFLALPDSFSPPGLDADMVLCSVLFDATPLGLAYFAVQGPVQEALLSSLFNDTLLMRDMLLAGGPAENQYGPAMAIYSAITQSSKELSRLQPPSDAPWDDRNQSTVLRRLALGTALAHAVPIQIIFSTNASTVDPVARYRNYESAYLAGDLDPAFEVLTVFECKMMADSDALEEDLVWARTTMANYRPDYIAREYTWRYTQQVHQEVPYGDPICGTFMPGVCNGHYSQIPVAGGECGWRAFFSRFVRKAFGLPTWGVTQPGHAAMSSWSPAGGWSIQLGASWFYSWWGPRSGEDFYLEAQAREVRSNFQMILRGGWVAKARGEAPVSINWVPSNPKAYGQGGVWGALMLYAKKIFVNATSPLPPRAIGASVVPTKVAALISAWPEKWPAPNVTTDSNGTIIIPAAAVSYVNRTSSATVMKSFDLLGEQLLTTEGSYIDPAASSFAYQFTVPEAGTRYLTSNITTWHMNTDLLLRVNNASDDQLINVPVYYTFGYWNQTQPVEIQLNAGKNVLTFMRTTENIIPMTIKEFFIYLEKPIFPAPPANYTPTPPAPRPDKFIEVPDTTTCAKQGITDVPSQFCKEACEALSFKYSGGKPTVNMTGCFVLSSGKDAGVCTFNTNATASICPQQPCTIDGSNAQQICLRQ